MTRASTPAYRSRYADQWLDRLISELPAVLLVGPRAAGKTWIGLRRAASVIRLDDPAEAAAMAASPDAALRGYEEPVLIDEWQMVPEILGAVKRTVDADPSPGRFIITGSVRAAAMAPTWPGTGRLTRFTVYPMTVREQLGRLDDRSILERLESDWASGGAAETMDLRDYVETALVGGFPYPALALQEAGREAWFDSYTEDLLDRDIPALEGQLTRGRDRSRLRRYLEAYAARSAGSAADRTIYEAADLNRKTAIAYEGLLDGVSLVDRVSSWRSNRLRRLVSQPKRYLVDSALLAAIIGVEAQAALKDGDVLGRILDTFVLAQLRPELLLVGGRPRLHHLRTQGGGHEVDIIIEVPGKGVIAIEVKATASPSHGDARHLRWLRDRLGSEFIRGLVMHTGPHAFELDHAIVAVPIASLWR